MKVKDYYIKDKLTKEELIEAGFKSYGKQRLYYKKSLDDFIFLCINTYILENGKINPNNIEISVKESIFYNQFPIFHELKSSPELEYDEEFQEESKKYIERMNTLAHRFGIIEKTEVNFNPNIKKIIENYNKEMDDLETQNIVISVANNKSRKRTK